jgi:hypothetical protein
MEIQTEAALRQYRRMRVWRRLLFLVIALAGIGVPWILDYSRTDNLICLTGASMMYLFGELELRLKTMQVRLAAISDEIDVLRGKQSERKLMAELQDW